MIKINNEFINFCERGKLRQIKKMFEADIKPDVNYLAAYGYRKACDMLHKKVIHYLLTERSVAVEHQKQAFKLCCKRQQSDAVQYLSKISHVLHYMETQDWVEMLGYCMQPKSSFGVAEVLCQYKFGLDYKAGHQFDMGANTQKNCRLG